MKKRLLQIAACLTMIVASASAADQERRLLARIEPEYPAIAMQMNLHGTVKLKVWISSDGSVRRLEYIGGHPLLAESALKTVKMWRYEAGLKETTAVVEVKF
jgi:TonB family protein